MILFVRKVSLSLAPVNECRHSLSEEEDGSLVVLLLAERARSECARSTRTIEDQPGRHCEEIGNWEAHSEGRAR